MTFDFSAPLPKRKRPGCKWGEFFRLWALWMGRI